MAIASNALQKDCKGVSHGIQFWKSWNETYPWIELKDEKIGVICLVIMFAAIVMVFKMSEIAIFCIFCWLQQNVFHNLGNMFKYTCRGVTLFFQHSPIRASELEHFEIFSQSCERQLAPRFFVKSNLLLFFLIS